MEKFVDKRFVLPIRLFMPAGAVLIGGVVTTTVSAPCSESGAWICAAGMLLAGLACLALLVTAIRERSAFSFKVLLIGVVGTGTAGFYAFIWTILLCRGV